MKGGREWQSTSRRGISPCWDGWQPQVATAQLIWWLCFPHLDQTDGMFSSVCHQAHHIKTRNTSLTDSTTLGSVLLDPGRKKHLELD